MDAEAMVQLAERWTTVPRQQICYTEPVLVNQYVLAFTLTQSTKSEFLGSQFESSSHFADLQ